MNDTDRIDLAHAAPFALGRLAARPATRELVRDDGTREILEPRVMQVLVALARADGAIVTRDELSRWCWEDRVVGEDAINRVLSRLRRSAEGIGEGSFRIETITKVGYRLVPGEGATPAARPLTAHPRPTRRALIAGGGALALAGAGAVGYALLRSRRPVAPVPPEVAALMQQAQLALQQDTREGQNQAIGLYQRVVALAPDYADGWGELGHAYAQTARFRATAESDAMRARARSAGQRALALDPDNGYGQVALATARPSIGSWLETERALRHALADHPGNETLMFTLGNLMASVGRWTETARLYETAAAQAPPNPNHLFARIIALWSANRLEEADRLMTDAAALYPTHFAIWFVRFYTLIYSGRPGEAIALGKNIEGRPSGIPEGEFDAILLVARAIQSRAPADADAAMRVHLARARLGSGYAENTIQFACALDRIEDAIAVTQAYYFDRGFAIPEVRFTAQQGSYLPRHDRLTSFLFSPSTVPMRRDPRFAAIVGELGLARYWQQSDSKPDYLK